MSADPRLARLRQSSASATPPPPPPPPPAIEIAQDSQLSTTDDDESQNGLKNGTNEGEEDQGQEEEEDFRLKFCTVCASNNNRSMEGHLQLAAADYPVISFGTGSLVRLPGATIQSPNCFSFNTSSYDNMYKELEEKDPRLYRANGILNMLERNRSVKWGPERWQDWRVGESRLAHETDRGSHGVEGGVVDIVITCEERCWDAVVDDLLARGNPLSRQVHVFNIDIKDSHEEALVGGKAILDLADALNLAAIEERSDKGQHGWDQGSGPGRAGFNQRVPALLADWQERWPQFPAVWTMAWF